MSATLDTIARRLDAIEQAITSSNPEPRRSLNVDTVVALTGVPRKAVLVAMRSGDLPSIEIGPRTCVVRPDGLDAWLAWKETKQ